MTKPHPMENQPRTGKETAAVRAAEAVVVLVCGLGFGATMVAMAIQRGVPLVTLAAMLTPAAICIGLWTLLAWQGRAGAGMGLAALGLFISYQWADGWSQRALDATRQEIQFPQVALGDSVRGAHLWANGVDLGGMPISIARDDFLQRVPNWPNPPANFGATVALPFFSWQWEQCREFEFPKWCARQVSDAHPGNYFFQVAHIGQTGVMSFGGFVFPERDRRLQLLLGKARLADYRVSADWCAALDTFREDGWIALRKAAETEPAMDGVLSDWAKWKYHLDAVHTPADALAALQSICRDADRQQQYSSPGVAGRAVEILAAQIDPRQLVDESRGLIADTSSYTYFVRRTVRGELQFAVNARRGGMVWLGPREGIDVVVPAGESGSGVGSPLSPGGFVIFQAVCDMWNAGRGRELFQSQIAPDLLAWHYDDGLRLPLVFAANIGGPEVDRFLLAQPWQRTVASGDDTAIPVGSSIVNRWLYLLAWLNDEAGRQFRREHPGPMVDLAGAILSANFDFLWQDKLGFVFADRELAWNFWPRFVAITDKRPNDAIQMQFTYLQRIDAPPSAFVDAWKRASPTPIAQDAAIRALMYARPTDRTRLVASALLRFTELEPRPASPADGASRSGVIDSLTLLASPEAQMLSALGKYLHSDPDYGTPQAAPPHIDGPLANAALWLSRPGGCSPVVGQLAADPEPTFRLLSLSAVRGVPTPANRQLLKKLLADPDAAVRAEARTVDAALKMLAARPVGDLACDSRYQP